MSRQSVQTFAIAYRIRPPRVLMAAHALGGKRYAARMALFSARSLLRERELAYISLTDNEAARLIPHMT